MMKYLLVILMVAVAAVSSQPTCATTPTQWSGIYREIGYSINEPLKLNLRIAQVNYDRMAGKMKVTDIERGFGQPLTTGLWDYNMGIHYLVEEGNGCTKTTINGTITTFGVPSTAKFRAVEYIGAVLPNLGVLVNEYSEVNVNDVMFYQSSYAPANDEGSICIPVIISCLKAKPMLSMELHSFANLTTTLPDDPFSLPLGC